MLERITLEQAQQLVLDLTGTMGSEKVALQESRGRVIAEPVVAILNVPPFDRSVFDGYAFRAEDTQKVLPVGLKLVGEIPAGSYFKGKVQAGTAVRILTGSPLPEGANAVIRQEETDVQAGIVRLRQSVLPGGNVGREGEDIKRGETLFIPGTLITPAVIGILASQGIGQIRVFSRPRIALVSTGDELVEVGEPLLAGQIYNTNIYTLAALIESWGGEALNLGLVRDRVEELAEIMDKSLQKVDLVVTTGGASVGDYDVTMRAMLAAGIEVLFWRVAMKPGTPVICGCKGDKLVLGLSGNPAAAMISASLILGPVVRKMAGFTAYHPKRIKVQCQGDFRKTSGVRRMVRAKVSMDNEGFVANFSDRQQPGVLVSMHDTNALVDLEPEERLEHGQTCKAFLLEEWT
ncbi:MAG: molybdopterin molybdotransferase MoeA [Desulfitobacteriaceae bacterium]